MIRDFRATNEENIFPSRSLFSVDDIVVGVPSWSPSVVNVLSEVSQSGVVSGCALYAEPLSLEVSQPFRVFAFQVPCVEL